MSHNADRRAADCAEPPPPIELRLFYLKKCILLTAIVVNILGFLLCILFLDHLAKAISRKLPLSLDVASNALLFTSLVGILLNLFFIYGILQNNLCMATCLVALGAFAGVYSLLLTFINPVEWLFVAATIFFTAIAYSFMMDLRKSQITSQPQRRLDRELSINVSKTESSLVLS